MTTVATVHPTTGITSLAVVTPDSLRMLNKRSTDVQMKSLVTQVVPLCIRSTGIDIALNSAYKDTQRSSTSRSCQDCRCSTKYLAKYEDQVNKNFIDIIRCTYMSLQLHCHKRCRHNKCLEVDRSHENEQIKIIELSRCVYPLQKDNKTICTRILRSTLNNIAEKKTEIHITPWVQDIKKEKSWEKKSGNFDCIGLQCEDIQKPTFQASFMKSLDGKEYHNKVHSIERSHYSRTTLRNEGDIQLEDQKYTTLAQVSSLGPLYIPSILRNTMVFPTPSVIHSPVTMLSTVVLTLMTYHITSLTTFAPLHTSLPSPCFSSSHLIYQPSVIHTCLPVSHKSRSCCMELFYVALMVKLFISNITDFFGASAVRDNLYAYITIIELHTIEVECPFYWQIYDMYVFCRLLERSNWYYFMDHHKLTCLKEEVLSQPLSVIFNLDTDFADPLRTPAQSTPNVLTHIMPFTLSIVIFITPTSATSITTNFSYFVTLITFPSVTPTIPFSHTPTIPHHVPTIIVPSLIPTTPPPVTLCIPPLDTPIIPFLLTCINTYSQNPLDNTGNANRSIKKVFIPDQFGRIPDCWCFNKATIHCLPYLLYLPLWWWAMFMLVWASLGVKMCFANSSLPLSRNLNSVGHSQLELMRHSLVAPSSRHLNSIGEHSQLGLLRPSWLAPRNKMARTLPVEVSLPVCGSKRIVNNVSELETLRGCRVIEGNLQIVLIEDAPRNREEEWQNWKFPELVQITGFLLVYRVSGLRSLGQLFPNLAVIRGMNLHQNYALVIYDAMDLESVDLYSLTAILRGGVRIQKNFNLCYLDTVDWSIIVKDVNENVINNNNEVTCSPCYPPGGCPRRGELERCWSATHCQKVCELDCTGGCAANGECCHDQCAGGCKEHNNSSSCYACRHYNSSGICNETCYKSYYEYRKYQCVTENDCKNLGHLRYISEDKSKKECVSECPAGYFNTTINERDKDVPSCIKCDGPCAKPCPSQLVNTVAKAQKLTGCTKIEGPLIISITGGKTIVEELNASLGLIEEVTEYVRVFSSHALLSLNFLASLRVIGGASLYSGMYALYVHGNDNLEEIWSWENHPDLIIPKENATVLFHSNPKLCYKKIKELILSTGRNITEDCNMQLTNGNKVACTMMEQPVHVQALAEKGVVEVSWKAAPINEDDRMLTGYYIYYKPSKEKIKDHMTGRDACDDNWSSKYIEISKSEINIKTHLEGLKPDTQYALYVQSDTVVDADSGVRSEISYITTLPHNPSSPRNVKVADVGINRMTLTWQPPSFPNGKIDHYIITIHLNPYRMDPSLDFCSTVPRQDQVKEIEQPRNEPTSTTEAPSASEICNSVPQGSVSGDCCPCYPDSVRQEQKQDIDFEDRLYSFVYMRRSNRRKRSDPDSHHQEKYSSDLHESGPSIYMNYSSVSNSSEDGVTVYTTNKQSYDIPNLRHFSRYQIEIRACHQPTSRCPKHSGMNLCALCSLNPVKMVGTTKKLPGANLVSGLTVNDIKSDVVMFKWSAPAEPNGQIVAYRLSVRADSATWSSYEECVSSQVFEENNSTYDLDIKRMHPGRYLFSVRAYSGDTIDDKSSDVPFIVKGEKNPANKVWAVIGILPLLLLVGAALFTYKIVCRKETFGKTTNPPPREPVPPWTPDVYAMISSQHILDCSDLQLEESCQLGKGNFGIVMKGQLHHGSGFIPVAVKQVTNFKARDDILQEAKLMLKLKCYHLVHAYGVVPGPNHMFLVMELMSRGDLLKYLRSLRAQDSDIFSVLSVDDVCAMAVQIGDGMTYLASHKIVHRDLAARNCLVDDQLNIKIADFGMTRLTDKNYYKNRETKDFPVRWLPPEYLSGSKFTSQSDVWSYGIVLWEILTGGARPYQHWEDNIKVWEQVSRGYTLEAHLPKYTPTFLGKIVVSCWRFHGYQRPYFPHIIAALLPSASPRFLQHFRMVSFYHSPEGEEYKHLLETMQDVEDENEVTTPLTTPSPIPFTPTLNIQGPPLPPRSPSVLKWCPSFRLRSQANSRHTRHFTHSHSTNSAPDLSLLQQGVEDICEKVVSQELNANSSLIINVASTDKGKAVHSSPSNVLSASMKDNGFCPKVSLNKQNDVSGYSVREDSQPNPTVIPSSVVVHINKHGLPSSAISTATAPNNIGK